MQYAKTFRLFISSTFSDFRREREILQTKVFPVIREYAMSLGYTFQPIDLRWGVSDEAQLDQKTLELCLDEVRSCKSYDYPNFLFMLGDRYGWVPLPYSIEVKEFEKILAIVIKEEKKLLLEWYYLDSNQLPSSYILLERKGEYKDFNHWVNVESKIRDIFQRTAKEVGLTKKEEEKYFLSATEAEIVEGIIPYISPTKYQKEILLKEAPFLEKIDSKYVFGFFRNICNKENPSSEFIDKNREKIVSIKESIKKLLPVSNIFEVDTTQLNEHRLEEDYLEIKIEKQSNETLIEYLKKVKENYGTTFEYQVISFIKSQIDNQKNIQKTDRPLEVEKQYIFAKKKRKNFLETESLHKILDSLDTYISKSNIDEPFIIYGKSGSGKSALLAKAIEKTQLKMHKKVIYRFVGATPESSSSKNLLVSILSELGIDILQTEERNNNEYLSFETFRKEETFEEFSYRVNQIISHNIEDEVVIFIDAVDQLIQSDKFLWLPKKLPKNIKIIISVLSDEKYINENQFFETLKNKTDNLYRIPAFDEPEKLLDLLLKEEDRSIDEFQKQYFLGQFFKVETPLYVLMASQEMKHWKSGDRSQTLASTQHGIVKEFIENLSKLHHHNAEFVQTVFAYIYASKNGLSESELLQLLSSDSNFIQKMAPETWYENPTKELPFVHWSRLHTQLKPFLSIKEQDGEELIYFFHREFIQVISEQINLKNYYEFMMQSMQKLIIKYQDKGFFINRWGILYTLLLTEYGFKYQDTKEEYILFLSDTKKLDKTWIKNCLKYMEIIGKIYYQDNKITKALTYQYSILYIIKNLYKENSLVWSSFYISCLCHLANSNLIINQTKRALEHAVKAFKISRKLYNKLPTVWVELYISSLSILANSYIKINKLDEAKELLKQQIVILEELYNDNPSFWAYAYTSSLNNLARIYHHNEYKSNLSEAIILEEKALAIVKLYYEKDSSFWVEGYTILLNGLTGLYMDINEFNKARELGEEALNIQEKLYNENPTRWVELYTTSLNNLAHTYHKVNILKSISLQKKSLTILEKLYKIDSSRWVEFYIASMNGLTTFYIEENNLSKAIELEEKVLTIQEKLYNKNPTRWVKDYDKSLNRLSSVYVRINELGKAKQYLEKAFDITKEYFGLEHHATQQRQEDLEYLILNSDPKIVNSFQNIISQIEEKEYITLDNLVELAKYIAVYQKSQTVGLIHFIFALGFVELNQMSKQIFLKIINLEDIVKFKTENLSFLKRKIILEIPYENEFNILVCELKIFFKDNFIGYLR